jgi:multidrug efflux pump subunit AcrB
MSYMSSTASNDGSLAITIYFKQGTNIDQAAVNVQNRVTQATSQLPPEVIQQGITTTKQQNSLIAQWACIPKTQKNTTRLSLQTMRKSILSRK